MASSLRKGLAHGRTRRSAGPTSASWFSPYTPLRSSAGLGLTCRCVIRGTGNLVPSAESAKIKQRSPREEVVAVGGWCHYLAAEMVGSKGLPGADSLATFLA